MVSLQAVFGKIEDDKYRVYEVHLKDLTNEQFTQAVKSLVDNFKYNYFPLIAHFRDACGDTDVSKSQIAIARLRNYAGRAGSTNSVNFNDTALHLVVDSFGGWNTVCYWGVEQWSVNLKRMTDLYSVFKRSGQGLPHIKGYDEISGYNFKVIQVGEDGVRLNIEHKTGSRGIELTTKRGGGPVPLSSCLKLYVNKG